MYQRHTSLQLIGWHIERFFPRLYSIILQTKNTNKRGPLFMNDESSNDCILRWDKGVKFVQARPIEDVRREDSINQRYSFFSFACSAVQFYYDQYDAYAYWRTTEHKNILHSNIILFYILHSWIKSSVRCRCESSMCWF